MKTPEENRTSEQAGSPREKDLELDQPLVAEDFYYEGPYLVLNDDTPLDVGMCFSNEPMICIPGKFGVRLEDHFYMTKDGAKWFTEPSPSCDDPFGLGK